MAFNTPLGGIAFVFEELARRFSTELMVATLAACATAVLVARAILGDTFDFVVIPPPDATGRTVGACLLLGGLLGLLGTAYNRAILLALDRFAAFPQVPPPLRAAVVGAAVGLVAWFEPRLVGGGDPLIQAVLDASLSLSTLAVVFVARWLLGPFSYAAGTPGGLFAPLLVVGAVAGAFFAQIADAVAPALALSPSLGAIVGMAAFFTAVVRAPFTGTLLVLGMTGTLTPLLPVLVACVAATIVPFGARQCAHLRHLARAHGTAAARTSVSDEGERWRVTSWWAAEGAPAAARSVAPEPDTRTAPWCGHPAPVCRLVGPDTLDELSTDWRR